MGANIDYTDALGREISLVRRNGAVSEIVSSLFRESYYFQDNAIRLAVLGDLHGHITLALKALERWRQISGLDFDAIAQVGDMGVFDEHTVLDPVTAEMSAKDPEELGFANYREQSGEGDYFFGEKGVFRGIPFYFITGNHDDARLLHGVENPCFYHNMRHIPNGRNVTYEKDGRQILIGGLGHGSGRSEARKLQGKNIDILLAHHPPRSEINEVGDENLGDFVEIEKPKSTFFGHTHGGAVGLTLPYMGLFGLNEVKHKRGELKKGCIGLLEISDEKSEFLYLPESHLT
jgi:hypothetical protein